DSRQVTLAPRISRDDGVIDWNTPAAAIQCLIRAMQPWPRAQTFLLRPDHPPQRCLILESQCLSSDGSSTGHVNSPGRIEACDGRLLLTTGNGILEILRLQTDGRKPMDARSFLNGQLLPVGSRMGTPVADSPEVPRRQ
ncbi:MAG: hypothetical protein KDA85_16335, partial [Planctomycetaceae bacterium]|nr:hypothetical protein [Planctomycetaceae bacterium]